MNSGGMPSIDEATRSAGSAERRRLAAGVGLVLAGTLFVGLGAAGTVGGAPTTGLLVGGLAVIASLAALAVRAPLRKHERALVSVGAAIGTASSLFVWALTPAAAVGRPALQAAGALGFLAGVAVMLAALLAGVTMDRGERSPRTGDPAVSWRRSTADATRQVADGGTTDADHSVPNADD